MVIFKQLSKQCSDVYIKFTSTTPVQVETCSFFENYFDDFGIVVLSKLRTKFGSGLDHFALGDLRSREEAK